MTIKQSEKLLTKALLQDGAMDYSLHEYELEENLDFLKQSLQHDQDDYIFSLTENSGSVAMVLIEKSGAIYINKKARNRLRTLWPVDYKSNIEQFIPFYAQQLHQGELPIEGVKTAR